jgi:hypothetical protein
MSPTVCVDIHPFAQELRSWEEGVPVDCGEPWEWATVEAAVQQGAHKSALSPESIQLVNEDVTYQVDAGYAKIVPWEELRKLRPPQLKISPLAVIPQRNRRGRMILDLSFAVRAQRPRGKAGRGQRDRGRRFGGKDQGYEDNVIQPSVNDTTNRLAPDGPVKELGNVLPRILDFMATVPANEHIHFSKLDLADGYWRMIVREDQRWNFAYVMPCHPGDELRVVVPSALQMGWNESPAFFCAATETVRDLSQVWIDHETTLPPHPMEHYAGPSQAPKRQQPGDPQLQMSAVYVDDHIMACVENHQGDLLERTARATLHAIHSVFASPDGMAQVGLKDPISAKKLAKGDGRWATTKEILGYTLDGIARTVQLPLDRACDLLKEVRAILKKNQVALKRFRSIIGRLQHAARILPAAKSFFTPLYNALRGLPQKIGLGQNSEVRLALLDAAALIRDMARRPTHVAELNQMELEYIGYCDASAFGAGGVWFGGTTPLAPSVWRVQWPADITAQVVSFANPTGKLTNSDLELAGVVLQESALEVQVGSLARAHLGIGCDNSPAVAWTTRMATRSHSPIAHRLLRGLAMRQRTVQSAPPSVFHVAGIRNTLADVPSRKIEGVPPMSTVPGSPCPSEFLTHFDRLYPLQTRSWTLVQPPSEIWSLVIETLRGQRFPLRRWMIPNGQQPSKTGVVTPKPATSTHGCGERRAIPNKNISWPLPPEFALDSSDMVSKLDSKVWKRPCVTWRRPSFWPDMKTPVRPPVLTI